MWPRVIELALKLLGTERQIPSPENRELCQKLQGNQKTKYAIVMMRQGGQRDDL